MNKAVKISLYVLIIFFVVMGILMTSYLIHETFHIFHMKGAMGIGLSFGTRINDSVQKGFITLYTGFDLAEYNNIEEYTSLRMQSEKIAYIISDAFEIMIGFIIGGLLTYRYMKRRELK